MRRSNKGWKYESARHGLAAKGVKTGRRSQCGNLTPLHAYAEKGERLFKIDDHVSIVAHWEKTRYGFRHVAVLMVDGRAVDKASAAYYNRTWESYEYETVMKRLIEKTSELSPEQKASAKAYLDKDRTDWSGFKTTAMVAKMGEVFGRTEKEQNDWKKRMLEAGLGSRGLQMPEDWDTLSEAEKKRRLDKVIGVLDDKKSLEAKGIRGFRLSEDAKRHIAIGDVVFSIPRKTFALKRDGEYAVHYTNEGRREKTPFISSKRAADAVAMLSLQGAKGIRVVDRLGKSQETR